MHLDSAFDWFSIGPKTVLASWRGYPGELGGLDQAHGDVGGTLTWREGSSAKSQFDLPKTIVTVLPEWMFDPGICAAMTLGTQSIHSAARLGV